MTEPDVTMVSHLMRRAGFGASRTKLEELSTRPYEEVVEDLLYPERFPEIEEELIQRYHMFDGSSAVHWIYKSLASQRQLQEKMALFWHHVFATGRAKSEHGVSLDEQFVMLRRVVFSDLRTILTELSKDPAMLYWLDNNENIKGEPNENYGRELLELFSMGVGNYSEEDVKQCALAFTGWSYHQPLPRDPWYNYPTEFTYNESDHDYGVKTFLGETGCFNGEDVIDIIVKQPATAKFIARRLYDFFVADEPQVPAWDIEPPRDPQAIDILVGAYFEFNRDIRSVLRVLFNSDFFKEARFKKIKSPLELVTGVINLVGVDDLPIPETTEYHTAITYMGQELANPPSVESWHTGTEWIDGGALNERVNFAVNKVSDLSRPGMIDLMNRVRNEGDSLSPGHFVDKCLELVGPVEVDEETKKTLLTVAESGGELTFSTETEIASSTDRIVQLVRLIVSSSEYQYA